MKSFNFKNSILFCLISLLLSSCSYLGNGGAPSLAAKPLSQQEKAQLSFETVQTIVFQQSCNRCHGSAGGINLETYQNIKQNLAAIERVVFKTKSMPKGSSLSDDQLAVLGAWIEIGAPEKPGGGTSPTPAPEPEPLKATFESIKANIISKKCLYCHSGNGSAKHIPLGTLDDIVNSPREIVIPGNADESGIVLAVERDDDKRMPPPTEGAGLSDIEKQIVRDWITNGAKD